MRTLLILLAMCGTASAATCVHPIYYQENPRTTRTYVQTVVYKGQTITVVVKGTKPKQKITHYPFPMPVSKHHRHLYQAPKPRTTPSPYAR